MIRKMVVLATVLGGMSVCFADAAIEAKVEDLLGKLTFDEKIQMLSGDQSGFAAQGVARLGIPPLKMTDGPVGVRWEESTAFPVSENLAATWDTELARRYGAAVGQETLAHGRHVILGPCICIARFPLSGRNFENYGEDPYLSARMAVNFVEGVQGEGVIATAKHYAVNDQEWQRNNVDVIVSERALREIHLPAFEYAVKEANVRAVMSAYNLINGHHASENKHLLTDILKDDWGFKGIVMSDWVSVYNAANAANAGLDLEMPNARYFGRRLIDAVETGAVSKATIDDKVRRLLRVRLEAGVFANPNPTENTAVIRSDAHRALAQHVAEAGMVLLKNENVLPLDVSKIKKLAVIGPNGQVARTGGGGSSRVNPWHIVSPYEGIASLVGDEVEVVFAQGVDIGTSGFEPIPTACLLTPDGEAGLRGAYYNNVSWTGQPEFVRVDETIDFDFKLRGPSEQIGMDNFSMRWTGVLVPKESGVYVLGISSDDGSLLYLDGELVIDNSGNHAETLKTCEMMLEGGKDYSLRLDYNENGGDAVMRLVWKAPGVGGMDRQLAQAAAVAREADAVILCVGNNAEREGEGADVPSFTMDGNQDALVKAVAAANSKTVVVLNGGTPINVRAWLKDVDGLIAAIYPGQEGGAALANILFGLVNPSGKLPFSYIQSRDETYAFKGYQDPSLKMPYDAGVFVGYRYYDAHDIAPLFEFGYGQSYTSFAYSGLQIAKTGAMTYTVTAKIKNTGKTAGAEVVQLYVAPPESKVPRPEKELKGFAKVMLQAGETQTVRMQLDPRSFQYYDVSAGGWAADAGAYKVLVGSSSRDIRLTQTIDLEP